MAGTIRQFSHTVFHPQAGSSLSDTDLSESCMQEETVSHTHTHTHTYTHTHACTHAALHTFLYCAYLYCTDGTEERAGGIEGRSKSAKNGIYVCVCVCRRDSHEMAKAIRPIRNRSIVNHKWETIFHADNLSSGLGIVSFRTKLTVIRKPLTETRSHINRKGPRCTQSCTDGEVWVM